MAYNLTTSGTLTYAAGKFGNAVNTTNGYLQYASTIWTSTGTIEAWVNTTYTGTAVAIGSDSGFWMGVDGNHYAHAVIASSGTADIVSSITINDGSWHHLAVTYSAGNAQLWVDGALGGSGSYSASNGPANGTTGFTLGKFQSSGYVWSGMIDETRFSNNVRYTSSFTPSSSAFTADTNTIALYHLEADGTDSGAVANASTSRFVRNIDLTSLIMYASGSQNANTQTASYTLGASDMGKIIEMNVSSNNTVTIPPNSSVAFPVGALIDVTQIGLGQTNVVAGSGVTLDAPRGTAVYARYQTVRLRQRATNEWIVWGNVTPFYDPTTIGSIIYRLRASTIGMTTDGANVSSAPLEIGGITLTSSGSGQPIWRASGLNGKPYISFNGSTTYLSLSSGATTYNQPVTACVVSQIYDYTASQELLKMGGIELLLNQTSNQSDNTWSTYAGSLINAAYAPLSSIQSFTGVFGAAGSQGSIQMYTNGVLASSGGGGGSGTSGGDFWIGTHPSTPRYLNADLYEILVFNKTMATSDLNLLFNYVKATYL